MSFDTWLIYLLASIGLSLSPGPNRLLALTHGVLHGRRKTGFTILGGVFSFVVVIGLSMFGIGALLQASLGWLTALKWLGRVGKRFNQVCGGIFMAIGVALPLRG